MLLWSIFRKLQPNQNKVYILTLYTTRYYTSHSIIGFTESFRVYLDVINRYIFVRFYACPSAFAQAQKYGSLKTRKHKASKHGK